MNNLYIHSCTSVSQKEIDKFRVLPQYRKATDNMIASSVCCAKTFALNPGFKKSDLALILATYFGEVSSSLDFLTTLHDQNIARPISFQNSLHNSTLGFISIEHKIIGPAITVSADLQTDSAVMNTAHALLQMSSQVLVCYVDMIPHFLAENYEQAMPQLKESFGWARAFIIGPQKSNNSRFELINQDNFNLTDYFHLFESPCL